MSSTALTPSAVHGAILFTKAFRSLLTWVSAYLAAKLFQDKYMQQVYIDRIAPSGLTGFVVTFAMFQAAFAALSIAVMGGVTYVLAGTRAELGVLVRFAVMDVVAELVAGLSIIYVVANVMQNKKYFNYKYEGLRAIRALRSIAFQVNMVTANIPYYMLFGDLKMALAVTRGSMGPARSMVTSGTAASPLGPA